jgi:hypothetical protein
MSVFTNSHKIERTVHVHIVQSIENEFWANCQFLLNYFLLNH